MHFILRFFTLERLRSAVTRYQWFFLPFLLGFLIPAVRHTQRVHFIGSVFLSDHQYPWTSYFIDPHVFSPDLLGTSDPNALDVQITGLWRRQCGNSRSRYSYSEDIYSGPYEAGTDERAAQEGLKRLAASRPEAPWINTLRLLSVAYGKCPLNPRIDLDDWNMGYRGGNTPAQAPYHYYYLSKGDAYWKKLAHELIAVAAAQAVREPQNAFPLLVRAQLHYILNMPVQAEADLAAAAKRTRYDDASAALAGYLLRSYNRRQAMTAEERSNLLNNFLRCETCDFQVLTERAAERVEGLRANGHLAQAVQLADSLVRCGLLLSRQTRANRFLRPNTLLLLPGTNLSLAALGAWRKAGQHLHPKQSARAALTAECARAGLQSQAKAVLEILNQTPLNGARNPRSLLLAGDPDTVSQSLRFSGLILLVYGVFPLIVWWFIALILIRGVGQPSTRAARLGVALPICVVSVLLVVFVWCYEELSYPAMLPGGPPAWRREEVVGVLGVVAALLPVFGTLLLCTVLTWYRYRPSFRLPLNLEREMKLSRFDARLLVGLVPTLAISAWIALLLNTVLWALASWYGWLSVDLLAWVPVQPNRVQPSFDYNFSDGWAAGYSLWVCGIVCFLLILKWRFATEKNGRVATHFGLRWWKECLGCVLASIAWLYLFLALLAWPWQRALDRSLEPPAGTSYLLAEWTR